MQSSLILNGVRVPIIKGEGCGNRFLLVDCLDLMELNKEEIINYVLPLLIKEGADDALILNKIKHTEIFMVLEMIVLEPDGSIAEFCGNGARVTACYLKYKYADSRKYYLKTNRGLRKIWWEDNIFHVDMGKTAFNSKRGKFFGTTFEPFRLGLGMRNFNFFWTETLEPHLVTFDQICEQELYDLGIYLNLHQRDFFPLGININSAELVSEGVIKVITFERGVNRITLACGTGATSSAMLAVKSGRLKKREVQIFLKGGVLKIHIQKEKAIMSGPATLNF